MTAVEQGKSMAWTTAMRDLGRIRSRVIGRLIGSTATGRSGVLRYGGDVRGVASIEMALMFPMMLVVFVGLVDVSNLITANRRVTLTASTLGDLVTQAPGAVTTADLDGFFSAASPIMDPFPASSTSLELYTFTNSGGAVALDWQYKSVNANCGAAPTPDATMTNLMAEGNDVVVSRTCYAWEPLLGIILGFSASTIQDQLMLRPRQSSRIVCDDC
jgi:Flp pilus assembly protein TadG